MVADCELAEACVATSRSGAQEASGHPKSITEALDASHSIHRAFRCLLSLSSPGLTRREQRTGLLCWVSRLHSRLTSVLHWAHQVQDASPDVAKQVTWH